MVMILHQFPSVYVDEPFTNVGRSTSYIRCSRYRMMKFKRRSRIIELVEIMNKARVILCVKKYIPSVYTLIDHVVKLHHINIPHVGRRTSYMGARELIELQIKKFTSDQEVRCSMYHGSILQQNIR